VSNEGARRAVPWSIADARLAASTLAVGVALLSWGWWTSSGTATLNQAVSGVALGVVAAIAVVGGSLTWVTAGRRSVRQRRHDVLGRLADSDLLEHLAGSSSPSSDDGLVGLVGSSRYHRGDCLLVQGKRVQQLSRLTRPTRDRTPCEMCQP